MLSQDSTESLFFGTDVTSEYSSTYIPVNVPQQEIKAADNLEAQRPMIQRRNCLNENQNDEWKRDLSNNTDIKISEKDFMDFWNCLSLLIVNHQNEQELFRNISDCNTELINQTDPIYRSDPEDKLTISNWRVSLDQILDVFCKNESLMAFFQQKHANIRN